MRSGVLAVARKRAAEKWGPNQDAYDLHRRAEGLLLAEFIKVARRDGYQLPVDTTNDAAGPDAHQPVVTLAQHYRLPTSLLDFTWDPRVAMFWAIDGAPCAGAGAIAIWAIKEGGWKQVKPHHPDRVGNRNLLAQDGVTVEVYLSDSFYRARGRFPGLEEARGIPSEDLRKLTLPYSEVLSLRRRLDLNQITYSRLTPSLYGVTQTALGRFAR